MLYEIDYEEPLRYVLHAAIVAIIDRPAIIGKHKLHVLHRDCFAASDYRADSK